ncbi:unnamed protein product [Amoebophrya sp. A120]|nr:unnamed protein product [Amoebophrya sp. A120]|eukprot:GSA120T00010986001.1
MHLTQECSSRLFLSLCFRPGFTREERTAFEAKPTLFRALREQKVAIQYTKATM